MSARGHHHRRAALRLGQDQRHHRRCCARFARRGLAVRGAKSGPDYIDPGFHAAATGLPGVNLDSWAMPPALLDALAAQAADGADLVILESAMGLFDGIPAAPGPHRLGRRSRPALRPAGAAGARRLRPVADGGRRRQGLCHLRSRTCAWPASCSTGSAASATAGCAGDAIEAIGLPVVGAILRDPTLTLPERHLGLVQAGEHDDLMAHLDRLADMVEKSLDLDAILALAAPLDAGGRRLRRTPCRRPASASRSPRMPPSPSSIRMSPPIGARPAPRSCRSRRSPTSRRRTIATSAGCRAAIPNFTPARIAAAAQFPRRHGSVSPRRGPSMASAAASWCSAKTLEDADRARRTKCSACSATPPASPSAR